MLALLLACAPHVPPAYHASGSLLYIEEPELAAVLTAATGRPLVVSAWASWCQPCLAELPVLDRFALAHPDARVILLNVDEPGMRAEASRIAGLYVTPTWFLVASDPAAALARVWPGWAGGIPATVVVDRAGTVTMSYKGVVPLSELEAAVQAAPPGSVLPRW